MCEYKLGTAPAPCKMGGAIAGGSHFGIMCSRFLAFFVTSAQLGSIINPFDAYCIPPIHIVRFLCICRNFIQ